MVIKNKHIFSPLKGIFSLLAVAMIVAILPVLLVSAAGGGVTPATAVVLTDGENTGSLEPLEQHWFKFTPPTTDVEHSLALEINPNKTNTIKFVTLKVFDGTQVKFFTNGDTSDMSVFGQAKLVLNTPESGERFWSDKVSAPKTYYVQLINESDFPFDYTLLSTSNAPEPPVEEEEPPEPEVQAEPEPEVQAEPEVIPPPIIVKESNNPGDAEVLEPGRVQGRLASNSTYWYTFSLPNLGESDFQDLEYTMFFTPDDGNRRHQVTFELYPYSDYELWRRGDSDQMQNFGAGSIVDRDGDDVTGERLWSGGVIKGDQYFLAINNGNDIAVDYWLYDADVDHPILGEQPIVAPPRVFAQGEAPEAALPLKVGVNDSNIQPGGEEWYTFRIADLDNDAFEEMALTMVCTPDDGNRIRNITFDVYTNDGVKYWSPGVNSDIINMGAGSVVYRDNNDLTGERFWSGWVNDGDIYYVQIRNGTQVDVDCHLFTGDVYGPELGEPTKPKGLTPADPGKAPYTAQALDLDVNDGKLAPGEEEWFTFRRSEGRPGDRIETIFTMIFTPDDGNRKHRINFELFEGNQLRDWASDNRFNIVAFGKGSIVERDGGIETGEYIWKGHVNSGDTYYMRVYNESDETIDFHIYPDDIIGTSLQRGVQ